MWEKKNTLTKIKNEIETEKQKLTERIMEVKYCILNFRIKS